MQTSLRWPQKTRELHNHHFDSTVWNHFTFRDDDVVVVAHDVADLRRTVTLRPRAGVPALVAELYDGSGVLTVVWLGRRNIEGIQPGRKLRVRGRVAQREGRPVVFNPSYELLTGGPE